MIKLIKKPGCLHFSKHGGKPITRDSICCVVVHYTAAELSSTLNWFFNSESKVSSHVVIDKDGTIYELFGPEKITWHAGVSNWRDKKNINYCSYGIELIASVADQFTFTDEQYQACKILLWGGPILLGGTEIGYVGLADKYSFSDHNIGKPNADILGHEHISPGRKSDPGINFDWEKIKKPLQNNNQQAAETKQRPLQQPQMVVDRSIYQLIMQSIRGLLLKVKKWIHKHL